MSNPQTFPAKVALLKVGVPCPEGFIYDAEALEKAAEDDPKLTFDGETLWYHNDVNIDRAQLEALGRKP